jgi:hypothetical protein
VGKAARRKRERREDAAAGRSTLRYDLVRLRFEDHNLAIVAGPAIPLFNRRYADALVKAGSERALAVSALLRGRTGPAGETPISEKLAVEILTDIYVTSVVDRFERLEGDEPTPDPSVFFREHPDVLLDVVSYLTNPAVFTGVVDGST